MICILGERLASCSTQEVQVMILILHQIYCFATVRLSHYFADLRTNFTILVISDTIKMIAFTRYYGHGQAWDIPKR